MVYKRRKKSIDLQRASLETLEKHLVQVRDRIATLESSLAEYRTKGHTLPEQLQRIQCSLDTIDSRLSALRKVRQPKKGILSSLLGLTDIPLETKTEIASFEGQQFTLRQKKSELERIGNMIRSYEESIERAQSWRTKLEEAAARKRRKREALIELRAAAAAGVIETRKVGSSVKRRLVKQPWCPYCGGLLGSNPHADHIYPVSKGGRSVPKNMVYVCSACNGMKRTLTLTGFIRKNGLNRVAIEQRLEELGKEY